MASSTAHGPGASDLGKNVIKTRTVTHWQPSFSLSGAGQPRSALRARCQDPTLRAPNSRTSRSRS